MSKLEKLKRLIDDVRVMSNEDIYVDLDCMDEEEKDHYFGKIDDLQTAVGELQREINDMKPVESPFKTVDMWATPESTKELEARITNIPEEHRAQATNMMMFTWNFMAKTIENSLKEQQGEKSND